MPVIEFSIQAGTGFWLLADLGLPNLNLTPTAWSMNCPRNYNSSDEATSHAEC